MDSRCLTMGIMALALVGHSNMAHAKTFHCGAGDVQCLITAINEANANGHKKNTIRLAPGTYMLTDVDNLADGANGLPSITGSITIESVHQELATLERAPDVSAFRLLHVAASGQLTLVGLALRNGSATEFGGNGGALFNSGVVIIRNSVIADNRAINGGGLYNRGVMTVEGSTVENNRGSYFSGPVQAGTGGVFTAGLMYVDGSRFVANRGGASGALSVGSGSLFVNQTTFSGNGGQFGAGAIDVNSGASGEITSSAIISNSSETSAIWNNGMLSVSNSTLWSGGRRYADFYNNGQAIFTNSTVVETSFRGFGSGTVFLQNSIISNGFGFVSLGYNVIDGSGVTLQPTDLTGDPGLDMFADDGSPGNGHFPLLETSQAIDAGNNAACPPRDQLGQLRDRACDIGAIEFQKPNDP